MTIDKAHADLARADRLSHIRAGLAKRIRASCAGMPDDLFDELIERMALVQLKYELHEGDRDDASP